MKTIDLGNEWIATKIVNTASIFHGSCLSSLIRLNPGLIKCVHCNDEIFLTIEYVTMIKFTLGAK